MAVDIFKGLSNKQILLVQGCPSNLRLKAGDDIFLQGDEAFGLFVIMKGKVAIYTKTVEGVMPLASLGPQDLLGEMALLTAHGRRTASARAITDTELFGIPGEPVDMFRQINDVKAAMTLMQNIICLLGERLRSEPKFESIKIKMEVPVISGDGAIASEALKVVKKFLPREGFLKKITKVRDLRAGEYLCRQGSQPDGFYFIHTGPVEIIDERPGAKTPLMTRLEAPSMVGELGYFSGQKRAGSIRAAGAVTYTHFSGDDFKKLQKKKPEDAFNVLFAAAQWIVNLIVEKQARYSLNKKKKKN